MSFLIGAFGEICQSDLPKRLSQVALSKSFDGMVTSLVLDNTVIYAGHNQHKSDGIAPIEDYGILVGKIFDYSNFKPLDTIHLSIDEWATKPSLLSKKIWGRYAGALYNKREKKITLVRDPLGLSTLFYSIQRNGILFSTEISCIYELLGGKPSLDFDYFAEYIINENQALPITPFAEIKELLPGMSLTMTAHGGLNEHYLWENLTSLNSTYISDENAFEEELCSMLKACTKAWLDDESTGTCVELSGGLDSSAVMILAHAASPKKLIAVNYIDSKVLSSNERQHAEEVAKACESPLYVIDWQDCSLLDPLPHTWRPNKPSTLLLFYNMTRQLQELSLHHGCPTIMNGLGGDHAFLAPAPQKSVADLWLERGRKGFSYKMDQISQTYRMPWWSLLSQTVKTIACYYGKISERMGESDAFLGPEYKRKLKKHELYSRNLLNQFYPAKSEQIESLYHAVAYGGRNQRFPSLTMTHPLLSQPVIELALRIPSYQSYHEGYNRIFLRRAVSRIQNVRPLWRKIKGHTTGSMAKAWEHHSYEIESMLMEGKLVKSGLIDKNWLQKEMVKVRHGQIDNLWPINHMFTSQIWLNQWGL